MAQKASISFFIILYLFFHSIQANNCSDDIIDTTISPPPASSTESNSTFWTIYEIDNSTGARCLDGSVYKFFHIEGFGSGAKKFMIFFPGGGFCGYENRPFLDSCFSRSQSMAGSSEFIGSNGSIYETTFFLSYFSSNPQINPLFANWNKIYLLTCDGTFFQGFLEEPILYNGTNLYFRGYNNTMATFEFLKQNKALFEAEEVIIMGNSSGGQAILIWMDFLRKYLPSGIKMSGISDAGLFLDIVNQNSQCHLFRKNLQIVANYTKSSRLDIFEGCKYRNNRKKFYKCLIPEYFMANITVDMFIINSQNDFEVMRTAYGLHCLDKGLNGCDKTVDAKIWKFREKFLRIVMKLKAKKKSWGFWLRRCLEHYYISSDMAWMGNLTTYSAEINEWNSIREAYYRWYEGRNNKELPAAFIDLKNWEDDCPVS